MTSALRPEAALAWLRSLSTDLEAAAVLDAHGRLLAGDAAAAGGDPDLVVARSSTAAVAARPGPVALRHVLELDVRVALEALETGVEQTPQDAGLAPHPPEQTGIASDRRVLER